MSALGMSTIHTPASPANPSPTHIPTSIQFTHDARCQLRPLQVRRLRDGGRPCPRLRRERASGQQPQAHRRRVSALQAHHPWCARLHHEGLPRRQYHYLAGSRRVEGLPGRAIAQGHYRQAQAFLCRHLRNPD